MLYQFIVISVAMNQYMTPRRVNAMRRTVVELDAKLLSPLVIPVLLLALLVLVTR